MIYTCTLNPAIDYHLKVDSFGEGKLNRTKATRIVAGGKGINVSVVLMNLGVDNISTGFIGGFSGQFIQEYATKHYRLRTNFMTIDDMTRINVKMSHQGLETEINAPGPIVKESEMSKLLALVEQLRQDDILVISGSPAGGVANSYVRIVQKCVENGNEFVLDTNDSALKECLKFKPLLVKPNLVELQEFFDKSIESISDVITTAKALVEQGAKNVIVSLGDRGNVFVNQREVFVAKPIGGLVKNTVGAGDSMVAGFLAGVSQIFNLRDSFRLAVACGTATAFNGRLATKAGVDKYLPQVEIEDRTR